MNQKGFSNIIFGFFVAIILAVGVGYASVKELLNIKYAPKEISSHDILKAEWEAFFETDSKENAPQDSIIEGLGNLCFSEEECNEFCKNNFGWCKEYCRDHPENTLCQKPLSFEGPILGGEEIVENGGEPSMLEVKTPVQTMSGKNTTSNPTSSPSQEQWKIAKPQQWVFDSIVQPVPEGASRTRLTALPAPFDMMFITGPYGAHRGGHAEGLDHEWVEIQDGTPIGSWADGEVTHVFLNDPNDTSEWRIYIDYGDGLSGEHMDVKTPFVKVGDQVSAGQAVAYGKSVVWLQGYHSGEFNLVDKHRKDGIEYRDGVTVSPFDYLRDDLKAQLIADYTKRFIEPYVARGEFFMGFSPWEPYLTNPLVFHAQHKGTLAGEWFLQSRQWVVDDIPDLLTLLPDTTKHYNKDHLIAAEDLGGVIFEGTWEADYTAKRVRFETERGIYYGIFDLDESGSRALLKIEYQLESYPQEFSSSVYVYKERDPIQRRQDAIQMKVRADY